MDNSRRQMRFFWGNTVYCPSDGRMLLFRKREGALFNVTKLNVVAKKCADQVNEVRSHYMHPRDQCQPSIKLFFLRRNLAVYSKGPSNVSDAELGIHRKRVRTTNRSSKYMELTQKDTNGSVKNDLTWNEGKERLSIIQSFADIDLETFLELPPHIAQDELKMNSVTAKPKKDLRNSQGRIESFFSRIPSALE